MRLVITGGLGFIGSNLVRHFLKEHPTYEIINLDAETYAGHQENLEDVASNPNYKFVKGHIEDTVLVNEIVSGKKFGKIDGIINLAAESHVDRSITGPDAFVTTNVIGTHSLLKAARKLWLDSGTGKPHRFHHVSTDEVYGSLGPEDPAFSETTPYSPNSPYSASKAGSDHLVRAYHHTYGLEVTTSNCSNNYGPYQFPEKLIPLFLLNCLYSRNLPIYGDGMNVRDWLHVEDHCNGIERVLLHGRPGETYNIGGGQELPNLKVIEEICATVDRAFAADPSLARRFPDAPAAKGATSDTLKTFVTDRAGHDRRYAIDETKARSELNYAPRRTFSEGFAQTLDWYLTHEDWWKPLLKQ